MMTRRRFLEALATSMLAGACKRDQPEGTTPTDGTLPPLSLRDDTPDLLLTYIDDRGHFHTTQRIDEIPPAYRNPVRVVVTTQDEGTSTLLLYVANFREKRPDGTYPVTSMTRPQWEALAAQRRNHPALASGSPPHPAPALGAAPQVIVYGASWCGPCHDAQAFLKAHGVPFTYHDIDVEEGARQEMNRKLDRAGMRKGTIPVLDVKGRLLVGFDPTALQAALRAAFSDNSTL
ncbi:MAG: glutaredoxin family protein [Myxococcales bacterium]|nr:glutaredoxin family protein [Polyangiaceae bacterium]MDW8249281.1 glutaredoxin family protein [Myxococcales bacterium]